MVGFAERVLSFDREGRLYHFFDRGLTYRRALDGSLHLRVRGRGLKRLSREEALAVCERAYRLAAEADLAERKEEVLRWSPEALLDDAPYRRAYRWPVSILPPDQYLATVLQATFGCTWSRCTFCTLYRDRAFGVRRLPEFLQHIEAVLALLGRGLALRRGVFLGDGNALALGEPLLPLLEAAWKAFRQEVAGFLDLYTGVKKAPAFWERLVKLGLGRVYIGLETGSRRLLELLNKPGDPQEAERLVSALKEAGLSVGLILLVGAGGEAFREEHFVQSLGLLARLPLDSRDLVYLSPFVPDPAAPLEVLDPLSLEGEVARLAQAVRSLGLRVSRYDIRNFIY